MLPELSKWQCVLLALPVHITPLPIRALTYTRYCVSRPLISFPSLRLQNLKELTKAHVESFNQLLNHNLQLAVEDIEPVKFDVHEQTVTVSVSGCSIAKPTLRTRGSTPREITPSSCRQCNLSYKADMRFDIDVQ